MTGHVTIWQSVGVGGVGDLEDGRMFVWPLPKHWMGHFAIFISYFLDADRPCLCGT